MQTLHFIFLLLEDVRWEGDFGDSDSWSSVLPCGNCTEMSRACMEVSWNLFPKLELSHHSSPWGFLPLVGLCRSGGLWLFQLHVVAWSWGALLRWTEDRDSWLGSWLLFPMGKEKSPTHLWCVALVLWNTASVHPQWKPHGTERKYWPSALFVQEIASQVKWQLPVSVWRTCSTGQAGWEPHWGFLTDWGFCSHFLSDGFSCL